MTRRQIFAICFFAGFLVLLYQIAVIFSPFLLPAAWALILAHLTFPLHIQLTALFRDRKTISAALLTVGIIALGVVPMAVLGSLLIREVGTVHVAITTWVQSGGVDRLPEAMAQLPFGSDRVRELFSKFVVPHGNIEDFLLQSAMTLRGFLLDELAGLAKNAFLLGWNFLVMGITLFFFFKDGQRLFESLYRIIPLEQSHKQTIFSRLDQIMRAVVKGVIITAIVQGLVAGAAYAVLEVPVPVFLMALTILVAPLPFGGTALVWGPVVVYLYWIGPAWKALAMLLWGGGIVMIDSVLKPFLIGQGTQLPVLFLFFSILGGLAAYGMIGLFLGPILLSLLLTAIQIYREEYQHQDEPVPPSA